MAETPNTNDQAERLRRLQERRAASGRPSRTPTATAGVGAAPAAPQAQRTRRRHPAAATRVFLAGLSVTSFFAVGGAIALANRQARAVQTVAAASTGTNTAGTQSASGAAAPSGTAISSVVHTTTHGS